ncbi:response regulator [Desulfobacterales bacterium HSG2]|nr:response regulator [Desulfobacterales bacterium HSG2]
MKSKRSALLKWESYSVTIAKLSGYFSKISVGLHHLLSDEVMISNESKITVLVIDDEPIVCESISDCLETIGFIAFKAENGRVGLEVFRREKPDIILADLRMPEVDGLDVLAAVTKESPETPIIVVSGTGVLQDVIEALRLGAWDYITKPIEDMAILEHSVCKCLERASLLVENRKYREYLEAEVGKRSAELEERTRALEKTNERLKKEIADHRQTSDRLRQAQKTEAIGTLASGIAHDFNNILFPIFGYTQMTMRELSEESSARSNLEEVLKAAKRAKELVRQILTFCRQSEKEQKRMELQPLIKEVLKLLRASLPANIGIHRNIDGKCGPVLADPTQIHQVMMNLCTNAYSAMREKGGTLEVTLKEIEFGPDNAAFQSHIPAGSYLKLTVSDTGHGMTNEVAERVFDPYFTTKDIGQGTGLGLSAVHAIVKNHNGFITVHSEAGKGTAFHVYLPVVTGFVAPEAVSDKSLPGGDESILVVDDEEQTVHMEKQMLEQLGYHVTARNTVSAALEAFNREPENFDLVITDMIMPGMTGLELSEKIMRLRPDIPIILCTGFSERSTEEKAKAMGIREYVAKPLLQGEIAGLIRRVLDQRNS